MCSPFGKGAKMKIEFKMSYKLGLLEFKVGDQLEISKNTIFESINDKYYMLILKGLRYDLLKEDIKIIQ